MMKIQKFKVLLYQVQRYEKYLKQPNFSEDILIYFTDNQIFAKIQTVRIRRIRMLVPLYGIVIC